MTTKLSAALLAALLSCAAAAPSLAETSRDNARNEQLRNGFSVERLQRVDTLLDGYVNDGRIAGLVALVLRDGKPVYERAVGWRD